MSQKISNQIVITGQEPDPHIAVAYILTLVQILLVLVEPELLVLIYSPLVPPEPRHDIILRIPQP